MLSNTNNDNKEVNDPYIFLASEQQADFPFFVGY
jgi:hypothetical protein